MITLLLNRFFPKDLEPSSIWYIAAVEMLIIDAPLAGLLYGLVSA